jgi:hypothetical protein
MRYITIALSLIASAGAAHAQAPQKTAEECGVEPLGKYLSMTLEEFDQSQSGWRSIGNAKEGCHLAAADLIAAYHPKMLDDAAGLLIHEAQGRAFGGNEVQALATFKRALAHYSSVTGERRMEENILQLEANVAFLEKDIPRLKAVRDQLAALPVPDGYALGVEKFKAKYPDRPPPAWPPYLPIVDRLVQCFGQPFAQAFFCGQQ